MVRSFCSAVKAAPEGCKPTLSNLCALYFLTIVTKNCGDLLLDGFMTGAQVQLAQEQLNLLHTLVRMEAVPLVEAFSLPDCELNSAIGCYDGNVYGRLLSWVSVRALLFWVCVVLLLRGCTRDLCRSFVVAGAYAAVID